MNNWIGILIVVGDVVVLLVVLGILWRYVRRHSSLLWRVSAGILCLVLLAASVVVSIVYWPRPAPTYALSSAETVSLLKQYNTVMSGRPTLYDSLRVQDENLWDTGTWHHGDSCSFHDGAYHIKSVEKSYYSWCIAEMPVFHNFAFQVKMTVTAGDGGGLVFRSEGKSGNYYYFHVAQDGSFGFAIFAVPGGEKDVLTGTSTNINTGIGQTNLLSVIVRGSNIAMFVNREPVAETQDTAYSSGQVGVVADEDSDTTDVAYSDAQVWAL